MRRFQRHFFHRVDEVEGKIDQVLRWRTSSSPSCASSSHSAHFDTDNTAMAVLPLQSELELPASGLVSCTESRLSTAAAPVSREDIPAAHLAIAHLGDEDFAYDKSKLRGPPLIHLSKDIERLCHEWESSDILIVNGRGIPVKYWGEFFKKSKTRGENSAWDLMKVEWGNWKVSNRRWNSLIII